MWAVTMICLIGTVLNCKKLKACFIFWSIGNIAWLIYDVHCGLYSRAFLDVVQLILAVYGLHEWNKGA